MHIYYGLQQIISGWQVSPMTFFPPKAWTDRLQCCKFLGPPSHSRSWFWALMILVSRSGSFPPTTTDHLPPQHLGGSQANLFLDIDVAPIHPGVHDRSTGCTSGALTFLPAKDLGEEPGWAGPSARLGVLGVGTGRLVVLANHFAIVACATDATMEIHGVGSLSSGMGGWVGRWRRLCGWGGCWRQDWRFRHGQGGRRGGRKGRIVHGAVLVSRVIRAI